MRIIAGAFRSRTLTAPHGATTRPTTDRAREAIFNVLTNIMDFTGARVLDLFGGSGALAFEAISRGAAEALIIEWDRHALAAARTNAAALLPPGTAFGSVRILQDDVYRFLHKHDGKENGDGGNRPRPFELIFADAPYDDPQLPKIAGRIFLSGLLAPGGLCIIERRATDRIDVPEQAIVLRELQAGEAGFTILTYSSKPETL